VDLDNANALFTDPSGVSYIKEIVGGTLTIAPSTRQSITDVIPGGGLLADRTMVRVMGMNFTNNTRISSSSSFTLPSGKRVARDIADFFPGLSASAETVRATVTAGAPIQMPGVLGDTSTGTVTPIVVTPQ